MFFSPYGLGQQAALEKLGMASLATANRRLAANTRAISGIAQGVSTLAKPLTSVGAAAGDAIKGFGRYLAKDYRQVANKTPLSVAKDAVTMAKNIGLSRGPEIVTNTMNSPLMHLL